MRVLVTGGRGFLGRYVIDNLVLRGLTPVSFDWRGTTEERRGCEHVLGDVRDPTAVMEAVARVDGVIHLAAILGTQETVTDPRPSMKTNIGGSLHVFHACARRQVPCTYVTVGNHWMQNSYAITKTCAERFAWMYNREFGAKIAVVRALNAYGPGQKSRPVRKIIPNFIEPALIGSPLTVYGDGQQVMDMIHVRDVADVLVRALVVPHDCYIYDRDAPPVFEAGTGRHTTVREIAELVIALTHSPSTIHYVPMRPGEPDGAVVVGNPNTLRPLYDDFVPSLVRLEDGLRETIEAYLP